MDIKKIVKKKYGQIAAQKKPDCCGSSSCCGNSTEIYNMSDDYSNQEGYVKDADLGLGCGIPTQIANIKSGDIVIDLGSGAGNDAFICAKLTGQSGKVIGIDMTEEMISKSRKISEKLNYTNIEFKLGDIENLPLENNIADVVVSNCVLNLVPDKNKAFNEIYRVLKPGGHFCVSDIVLKNELPESIRKAAEFYTGCISGAILSEEYIKIIENLGFKNISIPKQKNIDIPETEMKAILKDDFNKNDFYKIKNNIVSITITAEK